MGLFRVAAAIGTMGVVSPHSRQSRDTRAIRNETREQTRLLEQIADPGKAERERLAAAARAAASAERARVRQIHRAARREANRAATAQRRAALLAGARTTPAGVGRSLVALLGIALAIFFVMGAMGALAAGSITGMVFCLVLAAIPVVLLYRRR